MKSVWKTTTWAKDHDRKDSYRGTADKEMCALADLCLDLGWTRNVKPEVYVDRWHFHEPVYTKMSKQLLRLVGKGVGSVGSGSSSGKTL